MIYQADYATTEPERAAIDAEPGMILLEFGASWCGHCIAAQAAVQVLLSGRTGVKHLKIGDGRGQPLGRSFAVKLWPTLILVQHGKEIARVVRPLSSADLVELHAALPPR